MLLFCKVGIYKQCHFSSTAGAEALKSFDIWAKLILVWIGIKANVRQSYVMTWAQQKSSRMLVSRWKISFNILLLSLSMLVHNNLSNHFPSINWFQLKERSHELRKLSPTTIYCEGKVWMCFFEILMLGVTQKIIFTKEQCTIRGYFAWWHLNLKIWSTINSDSWQDT